MCGACGILGGTPDWVDRLSSGEGKALPFNRMAERQKRIRMVNRVLAGSGLRLQDFGGRLVLRSATGRSRIVDDLAHVWRAADEIGTQPFDPLDLTADWHRPGGGP